MKQTFIYGLKDPVTKNIRYVGKSNNPNKRIYEHHQIKRLKTNTHKNNWIKSLIKQNLKAELVILETCYEENWSEREKFWIRNIENLTNTLEGGKGEFIRKDKKKMREETSRKISNTMKEFHKTHDTKLIYEKISVTMQGRKKKPKEYCGVYLTANKTFLSQIRFNGKTIFIGIYKTSQEAAIAYDLKAMELFGELAKTNFKNPKSFPTPISSKNRKSSKYRGVEFASNGWSAVIHINGKRTYLGRFKTEEEANCAVLKARKSA